MLKHQTILEATVAFNGSNKIRYLESAELARTLRSSKFHPRRILPTSDRHLHSRIISQPSISPCLRKSADWDETTIPQASEREWQKEQPLTSAVLE